MSDPVSHEEKALRVTVQLLDARRTVRTVLGDRYDGKIRPVRAILRERAAATDGMKLTDVATAIVKALRANPESSPMHEGLVFAALCDEMEGVP